MSKSESTKNSLLLSLSIIISLAAAETALRILKPAPLFRSIDFTDSGYSYMLSMNRKLVYEPKPNAGPFNRYGHRGPAFEYKKGLKKRIAFMGDSVLEGMDVAPEDRFTEILNNRLSNQYEIINFGVEGYAFVQEFEYFKEKVLRFSPDVVIWCLTCNDLSAASSEIEEVRKLLDKIERNSFYKEYYKGKEKIEKVFLFSDVYRYIKYFSGYLAAHKSTEKFVNPYSCYSNEAAAADGLVELKRLAQEHRFRLFFVLLPVNVRDAQNDLLRFGPLLRENHIAYSDLNIHFSGGSIDKKSLFFKDDPCHLNRKGHDVVAERLFDYLHGRL